MGDGAHHGGAVLDVAGQPRLHLVEGRRRPPELGRTGNLHRLDVGVAAQPLGGPGELADRRRQPAGGNVPDGGQERKTGHEPQDDPLLPGVRETRRGRLDHRPASGGVLHAHAEVVGQGRQAVQRDDRRGRGRARRPRRRGRGRIGVGAGCGVAGGTRRRRRLQDRLAVDGGQEDAGGRNRPGRTGLQALEQDAAERVGNRVALEADLVDRLMEGRSDGHPEDPGAHPPQTCRRRPRLVNAHQRPVPMAEQRAALQRPDDLGDGVVGPRGLGQQQDDAHRHGQGDDPSRREQRDHLSCDRRADAAACSRRLGHLRDTCASQM